MLEVNVEKRFSDFELRVRFLSEAKVTALFAPSGSGKSLTLQLIAGLIKPDKGRVVVGKKVFFDSENGVNVPPQRRKVGFLFQNYALFPHMTVWENVVYGAKDRVFAEELLKILEIESIKGKYPAEISGGQKQRVALARALAVKPKVLLLDEPFSALHKSLKLTLYSELKRIRDRFGIPIVLVTHDIDEVFELSDYMVIMEKGKVVQVGEPFEVFMSPENLSVARLLGHKSFFPGTVKGVEGDYVFVETKGGVLKGRKKGEINVGDKVWVSILPFSVALSSTAEVSKVIALVKAIEVKREFTRVVVDLGGEEVELHIPCCLSPNFILEKGRTATFFLNADFISIVRGE